MDLNESQTAEPAISEVASAIGEPARARMLFCLLDGRARTSTELAAVADVGASTASMHLRRLELARLVRALRQGKHRYYSLRGSQVADMLERLSVLAERGRDDFAPSTPEHLRSARSCYDHIAGAVGVALHDRFKALGWIIDAANKGDNDYEVSAEGTRAFNALGVDVGAARAQKRRFACGCLDWSERRLHLSGALGAAFFAQARTRKWVLPYLDTRALRVTDLGRREFLGRGLLDRHQAAWNSIQ